jgi:hypothetical protein
MHTPMAVEEISTSLSVKDSKHGKDSARVDFLQSPRKIPKPINQLEPSPVVLKQKCSELHKRESGRNLGTS